MDPQTAQLLAMLSGNPNINAGASSAPSAPTLPTGTNQMPVPQPFQATPQLQQQNQSQIANLFSGLFGLLPGMVQPPQQQQQPNGQFPSPYSPGWGAAEAATLSPLKYISG